MAVVVEYAKQMRAHIEQLEMQRVKLQADLARIEGRLSGMREALSLYLGERGGGSEFSQTRRTSDARSRVPDPARSPGWAVVLDVLRQAPASGYSIEDIVRHAEEAGQQMSRNTLRSNLSNASSEHVIERVSTGRYRLPSPDVTSFGDMQTEQQSIEASAQEEEPPGDSSSPGGSVGSTPELARLLA